MYPNKAIVKKILCEHSCNTNGRDRNINLKITFWKENEQIPHFPMGGGGGEWEPGDGGIERSPLPPLVYM
jgi:hypothetical protein